MSPVSYLRSFARRRAVGKQRGVLLAELDQLAELPLALGDLAQGSFDFFGGLDQLGDLHS